MTRSRSRPERRAAITAAARRRQADRATGYPRDKDGVARRRRPGAHSGRRRAHRTIALPGGQRRRPDLGLYVGPRLVSRSRKMRRVLLPARAYRVCSP